MRPGIERSPEVLEIENAELRERVALLEDQVARMLASAKYDEAGSRKPARVAPYPEPALWQFHVAVAV